MASDVRIFGCLPDDDQAPKALQRALGVFTSVEALCTRFDPDSPLMHINAQPDTWHEVPRLLFGAITEAHRAYQRTKGQFDPRVLRHLLDLGYDRSLEFGTGQVETPQRFRERHARTPWEPRFRGGTHPRVHLGGIPIDLGGIGKGLSVRWAAEQLDGYFDSYLIDAGGDCYCRGCGPERTGWRVGVEDPRGADRTVAVLELRDVACATSSIRLRRWVSAGKTVHHLIDPRTGEPGGHGLLAVTVVADDPAEAEVLSKTLFLRGPDSAAREATRRGVAALCVTVEGATTESTTFDRHVLWRAA